MAKALEASVEHLLSKLDTAIGMDASTACESAGGTHPGDCRELETYNGAECVRDSENHSALEA